MHRRGDIAALRAIQVIVSRTFMRYFIASLLLIASSAHGADRGPWSAVSPELIRGHVDFLASDALEGRATASRGYDIASGYVAAQFHQAGLQPAGDGGSYFQRVPLLEATAVLPGSSAQLARGDRTHTFEHSADYLPGADFTSASEMLEAPLAFAGFGVDAPDLNHNDFDNVDVKGRIVVVLSGAPAKFPSLQRAYYSSPLGKWRTLIDRGAVGLITVSSLAAARRIPWNRIVASSWIPQMRWLDANGNPQNTYPELKLRFSFNRAAAARLFEGAPIDLEKALTAADNGEAQGFELPGTLTLSATTGLRSTESANVLGVLPGSDPALRNEYVVISAHLDHLGRGAAIKGDAIYNGAHDNAVGIGALLEIARAMSVAAVKPRRSILFAAVTGEEKGLLGSDYLVTQWMDSDRRIVANINIDMPMLFAPVKDFVVLGEVNSSLGPLARAAVAAQGYRISPEARPEEVGLIRSDQFSFIRHGVPALFIGGGRESRDGKTDIPALMKQFAVAHYHQPSDQPELPIDYPTTADFARINLRIALDAANGERPRWNRGDFLGESFAR